MDRNENLSHVQMFHRLLGGHPTGSFIGFRTHTQRPRRGRGGCFCCTTERESRCENYRTRMGSLRDYRAVGKHHYSSGNTVLVPRAYWLSLAEVMSRLKIRSMTLCCLSVDFDLRRRQTLSEG